VDIIWYIKKLNEDTIKNRRKFDKWIKTKLINIKKIKDKIKRKGTWRVNMRKWRVRHGFLGGKRKKKKDVDDISEIWQVDDEFFDHRTQSSTGLMKTTKPMTRGYM